MLHSHAPSLAVLLPSIALGTVSVTLLLPILPSLKAHWYTQDCDTYTNTTCKADFHRASQYSGLYTSLRFFIVFVVCVAGGFARAPLQSPLTPPGVRASDRSSVLGRLSDSAGRIPLLRANNLAQMLYVGALVWTRGESASAYFSAWIFSGLVSSGAFQTVAYIADCVPAEDRLLAFGSIGAVAGLGLACTPMLSAFSSVVTNQDLFLLSLACLVLNALYIEFVLPESLVARKPFARQASFNPIAPLVETRESRTLQWLCLVTFLTTLPETGVAEIAILYMDDVLGFQGEAAREFNSLYLALTGVGLLLSNTLLLKGLMQMTIAPTSVLLLAAVSNAVHMLVYSSLALYPHTGLAYMNICVTSVMFIGATAANAVLSQHMHASEQGFAMGTLDSVRSLVGAFGPLVFSQLFAYCGRHFGKPQVPFYLGFCLVLLACLIIVGPLKWSMQRDARHASGHGGIEPGGQGLEQALLQGLRDEEHAATQPLL
jgi:DHA1 family tetracycline resistance protein-like MFS transporter